MNRQELGRLGEDTAAEYLMREGYRIIERNFRTKIGELDIIAGRGDVLAFIEVKTRQGDMFGRPAESVGAKKQEHIRRTAQLYMNIRKVHPLIVSFDVIEVEINHIMDAFG
jgi:putative endonuclease